MIGLVGFVSVSYIAEFCADAVLVGVVCRLRRIQSSRYEIGLQMQKASAIELTYVSLVRVHPQLSFELY